MHFLWYFQFWKIYFCYLTILYYLSFFIIDVVFSLWLRKHCYFCKKCFSKHMCFFLWIINFPFICFDICLSLEIFLKYLGNCHGYITEDNSITLKWEKKKTKQSLQFNEEVKSNCCLFLSVFQSLLWGSALCPPCMTRQIEWPWWMMSSNCGRKKPLKFPSRNEKNPLLTVYWPQQSHC